jgi:lysophospholipase L1-like esterase
MGDLTKHINHLQMMSCPLKNCLGCIRILVCAVAGLAGALAAPAWRDYANKPDDWYRGSEGRRVTENILSWQSPLGSWPKIESNRPIFSGRDGVKKYDIAGIESERRNGYAWYGAWGEQVVVSYASWKQKWAATTAATRTIRLVIVGDSTVCNYPDNEPTRGWGQFIQGFFNESVRVVNLAKSGRSTKTFLEEGLWQKALDEKPAFVLIQFGHNDSHGPDRPESTDAATSYKAYLRRYVDDARAIGATSILVTPMCRRVFRPDGKLDDALSPYANAMKEVAAENKVGVIDLHKTSGELFQKLGEAGSAELANKPGDRTHFNEKGARAMAELVMSELPGLIPSLRPYLK